MNKNLKILCNKKIKYFDNASTTLKPEKLIQKYIQSFNSKNISNSCILSLIKKISSYLGTNNENISLVYNATYAVNEIVLWIESNIYYEYTIFISKSEHLANVLPWIALSKKKKWKFVFFNLEEIENIQFPNKSIISFSSLTNLDGCIIEIEKINSIFKKLKTKYRIVVLDATQMMQHTSFQLINSEIDFLFFSAHKFFGPFGLGVIYSKKPNLNLGVNSVNYLHNHDYSLDKKAIYAWNDLFDEITNAIKKNKQNLDFLISYFKNNFPKNKFIFLINENTTSNIFLLKTSHITAHEFMFYIEKKKFLVRNGKSCSHNLKILVNEKNLIRVSLSFYNSKEEINLFFNLIKKLKILDCF